MDETLDLEIAPAPRGADTCCDGQARGLAGGTRSLPTADLVSLLVGRARGGAGPGDIAAEVLRRVGGLRGLSAATAGEIAAIDGVGRARAARLTAAVELGRRCAAAPLVRGASLRASADVFRHYAPVFRDLRYEQFRVVFLDGKHRVQSEALVSQGTLTSSPVHPREVFGPAMREGAAAVLLVHNHPSGDPTPSADDLEITRRLVSVGDLVGIRVVDHVVVGDGAYASLADRGLLGG